MKRLLLSAIVLCMASWFMAQKLIFPVDDANMLFTFDGINDFSSHLQAYAITGSNDNHSLYQPCLFQ